MFAVVHFTNIKYNNYSHAVFIFWLIHYSCQNVKVISTFNN